MSSPEFVGKFAISGDSISSAQLLDFSQQTLESQEIQRMGNNTIEMSFTLRLGVEGMPPLSLSAADIFAAVGSSTTRSAWHPNLHSLPAWP